MARKSKKKPVSELDKSIIRELKKNRVFSKTKVGDITGIEPDEIFNKVIEFVNNLSDDEIIIYICDKMVMDGDINLLLHVEDTKVLMIHRPDVYQRLKEHTFDLNKAELRFYDRL